MDVQQFWQSTTIQGGVVQALSFLVYVLHLNLGSDLITQLVTAVFGLIGLVMVIYGRIKATKPLAVGAVVLK